MGKTINVTPTYRLNVKDEYNIAVEQARQSQPNPFKPDEPFVEKTVWREIGSYGKTFSGLQAAIKSIVLESAIDGLAPSTELAEFALSLRAVGAKIDLAFSPQITVSLDVLDAG